MSNQVETIINVKLENRDRKTVFWRGILVAPVAALLATYTQFLHWGWTSGLLVVPTLLALVFRGIYPSYVLSFNHALFEFENRVTAYVLLLTDEYPSIEPNSHVALLLPDVDGGRKLNRWLAPIKFILAIPLVIVGLVYVAIALPVTFVAWIITWSTGQYPEWALSIVLGTVKFWNRLYGYAVLLVTDEYPSFSL
jgi:hypothetical protein